MLFLLYFIFFQQDALNASRQGLILWFEQILPTLLPFSILSYVVLRSNLFAIKKAKDGILSIEEWYVILCGFLFGFPIGSKLTADLYQNHRISKERAQILCVFTNNLSPVFVTAALQQILHLKAGISFYLLLYGIPFVYGMLQLFQMRTQQIPYKQKNTASRFQMNMQIVDAGIINGFETLLKICGYIMMFSILAQMLRSVPWKHSLIPLLMTGCMEVTNGIAMLGSSDIASRFKYLFALFFLSLNGISGLFQTASILSQTDLSMRNYCKHKFCMILLAITGGILLLFVRIFG